MPYIEKKDRQHLDPVIDALAGELKKFGTENPTSYAGALNYAISRLIGTLALENLRYRSIAVITGVLENVKQEFYRRIAVPYEDKQIEKNTDVPEYENIIGRIKKQ